MKILIDTNIVLDLLLEREPFVEKAIALFELIEQSKLEGYIAATTITNIFYIICKTEGREVAIAAINRLLIGLQFCAVDYQAVETALSIGLKDFEDSTNSPARPSANSMELSPAIVKTSLVAISPFILPQNS